MSAEVVDSNPYRFRYFHQLLTCSSLLFSSLSIGFLFSLLLSIIEEQEQSKLLPSKPEKQNKSKVYSVLLQGRAYSVAIYSDRQFSSIVLLKYKVDTALRTSSLIPYLHSMLLAEGLQDAI